MKPCPSGGSRYSYLMPEAYYIFSLLSINKYTTEMTFALFIALLLLPSVLSLFGPCYIQPNGYDINIFTILEHI